LGIPLSPSFAFLPFPVWNYAASSETQHVLCYVFIVLNLTPYMFTPDTRMVLSFAKIHPCRKIWTPIVIFNHGLLQICWLVGNYDEKCFNKVCRYCWTNYLCRVRSTCCR
jgi:hypothetical protein